LGQGIYSPIYTETARIWNVFSRDANVEVFSHESEVLCVTYRPDGKQIAAASLGGTISFRDVDLGNITRLIEGKQDLIQGRLSGSKTRIKTCTLIA
jgi:periodic tryptophan protein 2